MALYDNSSKNSDMAILVSQQELATSLKSLGNKIKYYRGIRKMTQEDLAEEADINVSYLAKIENGYINTSIRYLIGISKGLKIKAKDLLDF